MCLAGACAPAGKDIHRNWTKAELAEVYSPLELEQGLRLTVRNAKGPVEGLSVQLREGHLVARATTDIQGQAPAEGLWWLFHATFEGGLIKDQVSLNPFRGFIHQPVITIRNQKGTVLLSENCPCNGRTYLIP